MASCHPRRSLWLEPTPTAIDQNFVFQDFGPIWIYSEDQANFMYYLAFLNGNLQRIAGAPCSPDDADCPDLK